MARQNRFFVPGYPQHVIQRGNNRQPVFFALGDFGFYRDCVREAFQRHGCALHAYVLMTNHVHLLATPATPDSLPRAMQSVGRRYAQFVNWRRERTGTLWEGRYRAAPVDTDGYFLTCARYIELNPVRAGMVDDPDAYGWSSYAANALGRADALVQPHELYVALGRSPVERQRAYRLLFDGAIGDRVLDEIRTATHNGWPVGSHEFRARVAGLCGRRTQPLARGGPRPVRRSGDQRLRRAIVSDPIGPDPIGHQTKRL